MAPMLAVGAMVFVAGEVLVAVLLCPKWESWIWWWPVRAAAAIAMVLVVSAIIHELC